MEVGDVSHKNVFDCKLTGKTVSRTPDHKGDWKTFRDAKALKRDKYRDNGKMWHYFYDNIIKKLGGTPPQQPDRPRRCPSCSDELQNRREPKRASACSLTRGNEVSNQMRKRWDTK